MNKIIKTFFAIIFLIPLIVLCSHQVLSADIGLSIYPPLLKVVIKPGKNITQVFQIENRSSTDQTLIARIVPFTSADDLGNPNVDPRTTAPWLNYFSLANSKIKLDQPFQLKAGQTDQIVLSLSVPITASLGDLYATLMITSYNNNPNTLLQGTSLSATIGSNILISVSAQSDPSTILKVTDLLPEEGKYFKIGDIYFLDNITPLFFTATARNDGEYTAQTKGVFRIERNPQSPVNLQSILPQYVLSKSQRRLGTLSDSKFFFTPSFNHIGPYSVRLDIRSENSNTSSKIDIVFIPAKILLGIISALIFLKIIVKISSSSSSSPSSSQ